jgi:hypothetical protein
VRVTELVSVFCKEISNFLGNISWRGCIFAIVCFCHSFLVLRTPPTGLLASL